MFGMKMQNMPTDSARQRANDVLDLVQLASMQNRMPHQISGGQQQRVALARALAPQPKVLLLDEPLSALDLKLRQAMRFELKEIQRRTGITFIFVTHEQEEALTMSDRIAVMSAGKIQQLGAPREIYERPVNRFVADFIGDTNLLDVAINSVSAERVSCRLAGGHRLLCPAVPGAVAGAHAILSVRPERTYLIHSAIHQESLPGAVLRNVHAGTDVQTVVKLNSGQSVMIRTQNSQKSEHSSFDTGAAVYVNMEPGAARLLID